jgi:hypothetical protein
VPASFLTRRIASYFTFLLAAVGLNNRQNQTFAKLVQFRMSGLEQFKTHDFIVGALGVCRGVAREGRADQKEL